MDLATFLVQCLNSVPEAARPLQGRVSEDNEMHSSNTSRVAFVAIAFAALAAYPLIAGTFGVALVTKIMIYAIFALSLELLVGGSGLVCLGHAAFFGIGAYAAVLMSPSDAPGNILVLLLVAIVAAGLFAAVVGALSLRTQGFTSSW